MRRLLTGITVLALLWCGWWLLGAWAIDRGLAQWRAERVGEGWQIAGLTPEVSGFPVAWDNRFDAVVVAGPSDMIRAAADALTLRILTYHPFAARVALPETPVTVETPADTYFVNAPQAVVAAALRPGPVTRLRRFSVAAGAWQVNTPQGNLVSADTMDLNIAQDTGDRDTYRISLNSDAFIPGDLTRQMLGLPADWPRPFDRFQALLNLRFDPADTQRMRLSAFEIDAVDLAWGIVSLGATGRVAVGPDGIPEGALNVNINNWRQIYEILKKNDTIKPELHFQTDIMLNGLSNIGGNPETIDLSLIFRDAQMFLGPIPLGPAPRIQF
jgi:hypothetical protein